MNIKSPIQFQVYEYLKNNILSGELQSNTLYSETKLAAELGISRTPIREALHWLDQDGYINIIPSKGFMIRKLNEKDMMETIQIRCAIEGFCTYAITNDAGSEKANKLIEELSELLDLQKKAISASDALATFTEFDHKFHLAIVNYVDNTEFNKLYQRSMYLVHLTTTTALSIPRRTEDTFSEHEQYLLHLKAGERDAAYNILIHHLTMPLTMNLLNDSDNKETEL